MVKTVPVGSSTPIHQTTEPVCPGFYDECDELLDHPSSSSESYSSQDHQMVASTEIDLSNLELSLTAIGSKQRASDALMYDVIKVFHRMKPSSGLSGINFKKDNRRLFLERTYTQVACKAGGLIPLKFSIELREICCRIWRILRKRSHNAFSDDGRDLEIRSFLTDNETCITLHLIVSTDGVKIIHSSGKHLYPLWLIIADLPPVMRSSFDNIAFASLWFGDGKPDFEVIFQYVQREVSELKYIYHDGFSYSVRIDFLFISADNVAKAAILNNKQFNGYFGCHLCEDEGEIVSHSQRIYPSDTFIKMRTHESYQHNLVEAQKFEAARTDPVQSFFATEPKASRVLNEIFTVKCLALIQMILFFIFELDSFSK